MTAVHVDVDGMELLVRLLDAATVELGRLESRLGATLASVYLDGSAARSVGAEARWLAGQRSELTRRIAAARAGAAPWALSLSTGAPVTVADGRAAGRQVRSALAGGGSPAEFQAALTSLRVVSDRARAGAVLTACEVEYLRAFYAEVGPALLDVPDYIGRSTHAWLGDPSGPSGAARAPGELLLPGLARDPGEPAGREIGAPLTGLYAARRSGGFAANDRAWMLAAVGSGLLALSNERNPGGGWGSMPVSTRAAVDSALRDVPKLAGRPPEVLRRRSRNETAIGGGAQFVALAELLRGSGGAAGETMSRRLMTSATDYAQRMEAIEHALAGYERADVRLPGSYVADAGRKDREVLGQLAGHETAVLAAGARNHAAVTSLLTEPAFVGSLLSVRWRDGGAAAGEVVRWLGPAALQGDPAGGVSAVEARRAYFAFVRFVTDAGAFPAASDGVARNRELAAAVARATMGNIDVFARATSDAESSWDGQRASLSNDDALRMLMLVQNGEARGEIGLAVEAYKLDLLRAASTGEVLPGETGAITSAEAGRRAGTLEGMAAAAAENVIWARNVDDADGRDAELRAAFAEKVRSATLAKNMLSGGLGGVPVVGWLLAGLASAGGEALILGMDAPEPVRPAAVPDQMRAGSLLPPDAAAEQAAFDVAAYVDARHGEVPADAYIPADSLVPGGRGLRVGEPSEIAEPDQRAAVVRWARAADGEYVSAFEGRAQYTYIANLKIHSSEEILQFMKKP